MWPWDNESVPDAVRSKMARVRAVAAAEGLRLFEAPIQPCDEGQAWSMAAIAAWWLDAAAVYRARSASSDDFLLLFDVERLSMD